MGHFLEVDNPRHLDLSSILWWLNQIRFYSDHKYHTEKGSMILFYIGYHSIPRIEDVGPHPMLNQERLPETRAYPNMDPQKKII